MANERVLHFQEALRINEQDARKRESESHVSDPIQQRGDPGFPHIPKNRVLRAVNTFFLTKFKT